MILLPINVEQHQFKAGLVINYTCTFEHIKVDTKNVNIFMINTLTMTDLYFYIVGYNTSLFYNFFFQLFNLTVIIKAFSVLLNLLSTVILILDEVM